MKNLILIIPLNALVSNAKTSHRVTLLVGGSGIRDALLTFSLMSLTKYLTPINLIIQCCRIKYDSEV
jgi:hypothetical protein